jgi:predicted O-methyltransferase YrrM
MHNFYQLARKFISYWLKASNGKGHGIHSPFVYDFVVSVLSDQYSNQPVYQKIESIRKKLLRNNDKINILDLGAGSTINNRKERCISSIARTAAKPSRFGKLFYRMVKYYNIETVLELGTSLGLSTRYFAEAAPLHGVVTIEGAPALADYTRNCLKQEGYLQVNVLEGNFDDLLPKVLPALIGKKLIFVDGNHRYEATKQYFLQSLPFLGQDDILIFDDIHWSGGMEKIWSEIKNNQRVTCTVDLFFIGIVFFRKEFKEKQDFSIRF